MANNNLLYNAAYSGALAGLASRWLTPEAVTGDATAQAILSAVAFATKLDTLIAPGSFDAEQGELLYSISQSVWQGRLPRSGVPNDYDDVAASIVGIFSDSIGNLLPVGGGGGAVDSVQGTNGITPTTPQTGVVTLDGVDLLPRDGSRSPTATIDWDGQNLTNVGDLDGITAIFTDTVDAFVSMSAGTFTGLQFNSVPLTATGPGTNALFDDGNYKPVGGASQGTNLINRSDGAGGWLSTNWNSFSGDDLTHIGASATLSASALSILASTGILALNASGLDFIASFGGGANSMAMQAAGDNLIHGPTGGASPGDAGNLSINGFDFPSLPTAATAQYLRFPTADGVARAVMLTDGLGQLSLDQLGSDDVLNQSTVTGATVSDALDTLSGGGGGTNTIPLWAGLPGNASSTDGLLQWVAVSTSNPGGIIEQVSSSGQWANGDVDPFPMPNGTIVRAILTYCHAAVSQGSTGGAMIAQFEVVEEDYNSMSVIGTLDFPVVNADIFNNLGTNQFSQGIELTGLSIPVSLGAGIGLSFNSLSANNNQIAGLGAFKVYLELEPA